MCLGSDASNFKERRITLGGVRMSRAAIAALISNRALCCHCIAGMTAMSPDTVDAAIIVLSRAGTKIDRYVNGTCLECGEDGLVYAIDRPRT